MEEEEEEELWGHAVARPAEKFFNFDRENAAATLAVYRTSVEQTRQLTAFFESGVKTGAVNEADVPVLALPAASLVDTLQKHLDSLRSGTSPSSGGVGGTGDSARANDDADLPPVRQLSLAPTTTSVATTRPAPAPAPAPAAATSASLWADFEAFAAPAPAASQPTPAPVPAPARALAPAPAATPAKRSAEMDLFSFEDPAPAPTAGASANANNAATRDAILSRYNAPPMQATPYQSFPSMQQPTYYASAAAVPGGYRPAPMMMTAAPTYGAGGPSMAAPASTNPFAQASTAPAWPGGAAAAPTTWGVPKAGASTNPFAAPTARPPPSSPWGL
jgi:hypothetical protein